jgi:hypothetical protein
VHSSLELRQPLRELLNRVPQRTAPRDFDRGSATTVGLRWEPTGAAAGQFPVLDADITLTPEGEHRTRLALAGTYRAPLGRLGAGLDKAILHRVATATICALLAEMADAPTSPAGSGHLWRGWIPSRSPGARRGCSEEVPGTLEISFPQ